MSRLPASKIELRPVETADLQIFFEHQREPEANAMAAFPPRERDVFEAHWRKILADEDVTVRAIVADGLAAGNAVSWSSDEKRLVGYWLGKDYWGHGIATQALIKFVDVVEERPLYAHVARANVASIRVLEKCGFEISLDAANSPSDPTDEVEEFIYVLQT